MLLLFICGNEILLFLSAAKKHKYHWGESVCKVHAGVYPKGRTVYGRRLHYRVPRFPLNCLTLRYYRIHWCQFNLSMEQ